MIVDIRLANSHRELAALYAFRYKVYVAEMGRTQKYADHHNQIIRDPLDDVAYNLVAWHGGDVVGCVRVNFARDGGLNYYRELLRMADVPAWPDAVSLCTRLMVEANWRRSTLAARLAVACYELGLTNQIATNFIDCNDHLIPFFEQMGYELTHRPVHEEYGQVNAMRFDLYDLPRLIEKSSPFRRPLERHLAVTRFAKQSVAPTASGTRTA